MSVAPGRSPSSGVQDDGSGAQGPDEVFDGAGNKIEVKKSVTMTEKAPGAWVFFGFECRSIRVSIVMGVPPELVYFRDENG